MSIVYTGRELIDDSGDAIHLASEDVWYTLSAYKATAFSGSIQLQWVNVSAADYNQTSDAASLAEGRWMDIEAAVLAASGAVDFPSRDGMLRVKPGFDTAIDVRIHISAGS